MFSATFLNDIEKDFKAEVIAAELVEKGVHPDLIMIVMLGAGKRSFRKDVDAVEDELLEYDRREYVIIKTLRESLYDMLPEGLFHPVAENKSTKTEKEIIQSIKQRRQEEHTARTFFLPFEATINHLRIQLALYENRLDKRSHYDDLISIFSTQWKIFDYLDERQANLFLYLIPILHELRDDHKAAEVILEMMFLLPVSVMMRWQNAYQTGEPILSHVDGDSVIGSNLTTGNAFYMSGEDEILVAIGPISNSLLKEFRQGEPKGIILELLCDYLLPAHVDVITEFILSDHDKSLWLAGEQQEFNCIMGEDTYL